MKNNDGVNELHHLNEKEPLKETNNETLISPQKESCANEKSVSCVKKNIEHFQGLIYALLSAILVSMSTTLNKKAELFSANEQAVGKDYLTKEFISKSHWLFEQRVYSTHCVLSGISMPLTRNNSF